MDLPQTNTQTFNDTIVTHKKPLIALTLFLVLLALLSYFSSSRVTRSVTVSGVGSTQIKPEKAVVSFSYSHDALSQTEAISAGESKFESIINGLTQFSPSEVSKATYQISSSTRRLTSTTDSKPSLVGGYQYVNAAKITVDKPEIVNDLVKYLYNNGAAVVTQVRFIPKDETAADKKAREEALKDAYKKANELARASGARVGKALTIQEGTSTGTTGSTVIGSTSQGAPQGQDTKTQTMGNNGIDVQASVTVVYELTTPLFPWWPW